MATLKKTAAKKTAGLKKVKTAPKKAVKKAVKKAAPKKKVKVGDGYACSVCGLAVSIDTVCGCIDTCEIICCGKSMKKK